MNRLSISGVAFVALFGCGAASAQSFSLAPGPPNSPATSTTGENTASTRSPPIGLVTITTDSIGLGAAGHFVILSKSGITDVPTSVVVGNVGTSPITGAADHLSCAEVTGRIYAVDAAGPAPCSTKAPAMLTNAIADMQTAYTIAAGRPPKITELKGGYIGGLTLAPGVYKWSTDVDITKDVVLKGGLNAVWIFQISKNLIVANGMAVVLKGFARAQNVYWQVAGKVDMGTTSHFEGIVLSKTLIAMKTDASINGRLLAQTAVTLEMNSVHRP